MGNNAGADEAPNDTGANVMEGRTTVSGEELDQVRMRLARNEVLGMRNYVEDRLDYRQAGAERLREVCDVAAHEAERVLDAMCSVLMHSRLTINFSAAKFFLELNRSDTYSNCFERAVANRQDPRYLQERNDVEKRLLDYNGNIAHYAHGATQDPALKRYGDARTVRRDIRHYATHSPIWHMMRPRYAALDFGHCTQGGASLGDYGKSFFVLRGHMKTAATYTASDSFSLIHDLKRRRTQYGGKAPTTHQASARFHEMEKLMYYAHPGMLRQIHAYGTRRKARGTEKAIDWHLPGHRTLNYIEAQLHTDVLFSRDVEYVFLCAAEINGAHGPSYNRHEVHKHAGIFARKHKLMLRYQ